MHFDKIEDGSLAVVCKFALQVLFLVTPPLIHQGRGIVFDQFLCLFLCQQDNKKTTGPICMKFSGKVTVWSDHGRPDYILDQLRETAWCRDAQHGGGVCCAFAPQLVILLCPNLLTVECMTLESICSLMKAVCTVLWRRSDASLENNLWSGFCCLVFFFLIISVLTFPNGNHQTILSMYDLRLHRII